MDHSDGGLTEELSSGLSDAWINAEHYQRLARRIDAATKRASSRGRRILAGVTIPVPAKIDAAAVIFNAPPSQMSAESRFVFEQPAHDGFTLAGFGIAARVTATSDQRFKLAAKECGDLLAAGMFDEPGEDESAPSGSGPVWAGGFAFDDDHDAAADWAGFPAAELVLPSISIAVKQGSNPQARLSINVLVNPGDSAARLIAEIEHVVDSLDLDATLTDQGAPGGSVHSPAPAEHFIASVARAVESIRAGAIEKIVLARELELRTDRPIDAGSVFAGLRSHFPSCWNFAIVRDGQTFLGASPELLVRREGRRASTMALAGSARRGSDPAADEHLAQQLLCSEKNRSEHQIVVERIERVLGRRSAWVTTGEQPQLVRFENIQHLATPIRAQLVEPIPVVELAGMLHPTPAVGGEPWPAARSMIRSLEGFDRGWYAGPVGWMDALEDGEFYVALRSGLAGVDRARLFAGVGIVADSDPSSELAETETKFSALLPLIAGRAS